MVQSPFSVLMPLNNQYNQNTLHTEIMRCFSLCYVRPALWLHHNYHFLFSDTQSHLLCRRVFRAVRLPHRRNHTEKIQFAFHDVLISQQSRNATWRGHGLNKCSMHLYDISKHSVSSSISSWCKTERIHSVKRKSFWILTLLPQAWRTGFHPY